MKRFNKKHIVLLTFLAVFASCADLDSVLDAGIEVEKPASVIDREALNAYDVLKSYTGDLVLGANASSDNISGTSPLSTLLETNFEEVTPTSALNQNVILSDDGIYDFTSIQNYMSKAGERGLSVYGDALVSSSNQNSTYLKSLIAPFTFYTPLFPNFVIPTPLNDGSFTDWNTEGNVTVENYLGQPCVKMVNGASEGDGSVTSLQSPEYRVDEGAKFEITFYVLSDIVGEGRVVFTGLNENEPELDWTAAGVESPTFQTKVGWNKVQFQVDDFDGSGSLSFKIEMGYTPNATYYMNIQGISLINVNGSVENPDEIFLECEDAQQIGQFMILEEGDASSISGGKYLEGIIDGDRGTYDTGTGLPSDAVNTDMQFVYTFNVLTSGTYYIWLRHRCHEPYGGDDSWFISVDNNEYYYPNGIENQNTDSWEWSKHFDGNGDSFYLEAGEHTVAFKIRESGHYFDRIYITMTMNEPSGLGSAAIAQEEVNLDLTNEEKAKIIRGSLQSWISGVLNACKDGINAWTVVKEPMDDSNPQELKTGKNKEELDGEFYWQDYLGPKYAAEAFIMARDSSKSGDLLFISDYGLEKNLVKCRGLLAYMDYVEAQGATIDGISTKLHLTLSSDKDNIASMLQILAESGKMVRISELKVSLESSDPTAEMLQEQADMYKSVVELYNTYVPADQRYGISLSSANNANGENNGLWDANYDRKPAYAGFADGFAGN
ncbi:endo-1,4-beta-xylanase [uncultured Draconibacterium sp.]|uniref:endo-1,4-beta-xylanase n=1 Tax=uncultured Draconibacterium sp. TaxID=1573823 RepID=UPI0025CC4F50|nr:endo-1,4-beta-xylanase [uncultured Draconibacterium sp.]